MRYNLNIDPRIRLPEELASKHWDLPVFITFQGDVNDENSRKFIDGLTGAENAAKFSGQKVLPVVITSNGGEAYACLEMIDAMKNCSVKIATIVEGKAFSAGAILFSCGAEGHRYMAPNATIMIHPASMGSRGKVDEVRASVKEGDRLNEKLLQMLSKNCGHPENYFLTKIREDHNSAEWYMDGKEAIKQGIANHIKIPSFDVNVTFDHKFG